MDTAGLSRSEIRQIEQLKALEAKETSKNKASEPKDAPKAQSSVAKKSTPARPAPAPEVTTPRATTGGKSLGAKGRAAAGGKSMGGKRPPMPPPGKKRKAGKRKKGDASSDDSSDDEEDDSSSSSSSEEEVVAAKMPLKKRGKVTPATPKPDSGDESSEFEDEFDVDFFKNDADRDWMMSLTELDRQQIISERREKQELAREAWGMQHRKKKAGEIPASSSAAAKQQQKEPSTPAQQQPSASLPRASRRDKEKPDTKNAEKRAALDDMEARKVAQQGSKAVRADIMEEEDEDLPRKRQEERRELAGSRKDAQSAKPRHRQIPVEQQGPQFVTIEDKELEAVRVTRDKLVEYAMRPFFGDFVQGLYVRMSLGPDPTGLKKYLVCLVIGVKDKQKEYTIPEPGSNKLITLRKHLTVSHAGQKKSYPISMVSNKKFEPDEVLKWCKNMAKECEKLPNKEELQELREKLGKNWKEAFVYDIDTVNAILEDKEKSRRAAALAAGNLSMTKQQLEEQMEIAWESYKECQKKNDDDEKKEEAYKKWEDLKQQVEIYDEALQRKKLSAEEEAARHKVINSRNQVANRTVVKAIDQSRNITCTRPYRQTVYFAFGESATNQLAADDRFTGKEVKQQAPAKSKVAPELLVKLDDDDEEAASNSLSQSTNDTRATDEAASALERAHINLSVQVDVGGQSGAKKAGGDEGVAPFVRAPNPLKPSMPLEAAPSLAAKNKLSLDDYKRRRGLI